jgi:hypothetical protein
MFKDRRVLIEKEIALQKQGCGLLYKAIVTGRASVGETEAYDQLKDTLMSTIAELAIIDQMIADGHE